MARIRAVSSLPISDGLGITLVQEDAGWRFHAWHHDDFGTKPLPDPPPEDDRQRFFVTAEAAAAYFRALFAAL
jgi:hypothetical protein